MLNGNLYLHGGGDPSFGSLQPSELADELVLDQGLRDITGRVIGDESAFDSLRGGPSEGYRTTCEVGPAQRADLQPRPHGQAPAVLPAQPRALRRPRVRDGAAAPRRHHRRGRADRPRAEGAVPLAEHSSPTLAELARVTNRPSDNFNAETLIKALGAEFGGARHAPRAGAVVVRRTMAGFGLRPKRGRRLRPLALQPHHAAPGRHAARPHEHRRRPGPAFETSLAVAGRNGTLFDRMRRTAARDRCQGKTGTLQDVSALAGYCQTTAGARVAFAILMNGVNPYGARRLQDRMVAALARYSP